MNLIKNFVSKAWGSATIATWASYLSRTLYFVGVLPLILNKFDVTSVNVWFVFQSIFSIQLLLDAGFSQTFVRVFSFSRAGAAQITTLETKARDYDLNIGKENLVLIKEIYDTSKRVYLIIFLASLLLLTTIGTFSVTNVIFEAGNTKSLWIAWGIVCFLAPFVLYGKVYENVVIGFDKISLLKKWDSLVSLGMIFTALIILAMQPSVLLLVINYLGWNIIKIVVNIKLANQINTCIFNNNPFPKFSSKVFSDIWPATWKSGLGIFMGVGLLQFSGIYYANIGSALSSASYLLAIRLITAISEISSAPFYSILPKLAYLRAKLKFTDQLTIATNRMLISLFLFTVGFFIIGFGASAAMTSIQSDTKFVSSMFWIILGFSFYLQRFGAMHLQLYSTTNIIKWHIANGISGVIFLIFSVLLVEKLGYIAFPIASLASNVLFYSWYSAKLNYNLFNISFVKFETRSLFPTMALFIILSLIFLIWK